MSGVRPSSYPKSRFSSDDRTGIRGAFSIGEQIAGERLTAMRPTTSHPLTARKATDQPATSGWQLSRTVRKTLLVVHVVSAGGWIGIDLVVGVLVLAGWFGADTAVRGVAYQALGMFVVWPMFTTGLVCLATGILLGLGTRYGLLRYWWVAVKLAINLVLCVLVLVLLRPGLPEVGEYGRALAMGDDPAGDVSFLFFPPAVSLTALSFATVLAVVKPWGRIGRKGRRGGRGPERSPRPPYDPDRSSYGPDRSTSASG